MRAVGPTETPPTTARYFTGSLRWHLLRAHWIQVRSGLQLREMRGSRSHGPIACTRFGGLSRATSLCGVLEVMPPTICDHGRA